MTKSGGVRRYRTTRRPVIAATAIAIGVIGGAASMVWPRRAPVAAPFDRLRTGPGERDNILLITIDTARADHFGSYGYAGARTRHLDRLAAEGVRFDHAYSSAPITLTAH